MEESVVGYANEHGAAFLWVTHSEDIAERLLKQRKVVCTKHSAKDSLVRLTTKCILSLRGVFRVNC